MAGNGARDPLFSLNVIEESMRIVFVLAEADLSGGVRTVATYARLLSERWHVVTIVSTPPALPPLRSRLKAALRSGRWPTAARAGPSHVDSAEVEHRPVRFFLQGGFPGPQADLDRVQRLAAVAVRPP